MDNTVPVYLTHEQIEFVSYALQNWGQHQDMHRVRRLGDIQSALEKALRDYPKEKK